MKKYTKRKDPLPEIKLKDPALQSHMHSFLGIPNSPKYQHFVKSLRNAKRRILGIHSIDHKRRRRTIRGGDKSYLKRLNVLVNNEENVKNLLEWVNAYNRALEPGKLPLLPEHWKNMGTDKALTLNHLLFKPGDGGEPDIHNKKSKLKEYDLYKSLLPFLTSVSNILTSKLLNPSQADVDSNHDFRTMLMMTMDILRELNLYANPLWFDEMYYYFYYLNLDKIFSYFMDKYEKYKTDVDKTPKAREKRLDAYRYVLPAKYDDRLFADEEYSKSYNEFIPFYDVFEPNSAVNDIDAANHMFNMLYYNPPAPLVDTEKVSLVTRLPKRKEDETGGAEYEEVEEEAKRNSKRNVVPVSITPNLNLKIPQSEPKDTPVTGIIKAQQIGKTQSDTIKNALKKQSDDPNDDGFWS